MMFFLLSGFVPLAAFAQQATQPPPQTGQTQQKHPDQPQTQNFQPAQTQQPSSQEQTQSTKVEPPHTPQQTDQLRKQERRSAEDTRINPDWTAQQQTEERARRAEERMIIDRIRQRLLEEREDHQSTGQNSRPDDGNTYPSPSGDGRYYYEARPYPRVKTCIEYENGDEFCRYRAN